MIVPGFALSPEAKRPLDAWLRAGGRLFQSEANDFSPDITVAAGERLDAAPLVWAAGRLGPLASETYVRLPPTAIKDVTVKDGVDVLARHLTEHEHPRKWEFGKPLFCRADVGRGSYYYLGAALEGAYVTAWSPWDRTDGHAFYGALLPDAEVRLDNKLVELAHLARGAEEVIALINHTGDYQDVRLAIPADRAFAGVEDPARQLRGGETHLRLAPSEVSLFRSRPASPRLGAAE